jgi:hypothetical protein
MSGKLAEARSGKYYPAPVVVFEHKKRTPEKPPSQIFGMHDAEIYKLKLSLCSTGSGAK